MILSIFLQNKNLLIHYVFTKYQWQRRKYQAIVIGHLDRYDESCLTFKMSEIEFDTWFTMCWRFIFHFNLLHLFSNKFCRHVCMCHTCSWQQIYLSKQCESIYSFFQWESTLYGVSLRCFFPHHRVTRMRWFHRNRFVMTIWYIFTIWCIALIYVHLYLWKKNEFFIKKTFRWFLFSWVKLRIDYVSLILSWKRRLSLWK